MLQNNSTAVQDTLADLDSISNECIVLTFERLLIGLRALKRWPRLGRTHVISSGTIRDLLKNIYENIDHVEPDQCPMHSDNALTEYQKVCKTEFERLGVTVDFK